MDLASPMGFIRTLLIIVAVYYLFKIAVRIFAPILVQKAADKFQEKMQEQMRNQQQQYQSRNNQTPPQQSFSTEKPREKKKVGEYIDFEEIK